MPTKLLEYIYSDDFAAARELITGPDAAEHINTPDEVCTLPIHAVTDFSAYTYLSPEVRAGLNDLAILLIKNGAKLDVSHEGMLPIHYVCEKHNGSLEVLEAILQTGVDPNSKDLAGVTAVEYAMQAGDSHKALVARLSQRITIDLSGVLQDIAQGMTEFLKDSIKEAMDVFAQELCDKIGNIYTCLLYTSPSPRD